jgi:asparagine synthase (glutamine-hydrolysing)
MFGFHRLAINGLNEKSNQPLIIDNITLICNGEIYNYKELFQKINIEPTTSSDCEIIIHLYKQYGIEYTLQLLDGVFAFVLYDDNTTSSAVYIARDPYGVRPLYTMIMDPSYSYSSENKIDDANSLNNTNEPIIAFASEIKMLNNLFNYHNYDDGTVNRLYFNDMKISRGINNCLMPYKISHFEPATYMSLKLEKNIWKQNNVVKYNTFKFNPSLLLQSENDDDYIQKDIQKDICLFLNNAVKKRVVGTTERPIACLLSGGLDSSLIAALVSKYYKQSNVKFNARVLETYSIGMEGSEDVRCAEIVAKHIGSKHTSIIVTEDDFFNAIPEVIKAIESYDTTSVRASVGNYLIGKYIKEHSDAKVIFNGDGSDELTGGYLYFQEAPNDLEFDKECKRLLTDIHAFDVLRSDKCISSHGLEPRTPFLDRAWVDYYLSIPITYRNHHQKEKNKKKKIEKYLLRNSFSENEPSLLPESILWRTKEAFSDGVSGTHKSWFEIIRDRLENNDDDLLTNHDKGYNGHNIPKTNEQRYYRNIYDSLYPNTYNVLPYFWMPRFIDATDASARTLKIYKK